MGGLAHYLEDEGIPTTSLSLIRAHTEKIRPPRALFVPFELGRPFGGPDQPDFQRRVLRDCLDLFNRPAGPVLEDFPDLPPGADEEQHGWACPVSFAPPTASLSDSEAIEQALLGEIALLRPWYEESRRRRGRSAFGLSNSTPEEIARFLAAFVVHLDRTPNPDPTKPLGIAYKLRADDLRQYYIEAAIARPDSRATDIEILNWMWAETTLGKLLVAVRDWAYECEDPTLRKLALSAMVPMSQRHHTKHG